MRNIPIPTNKEYTKRLIEKTEDVLRRIIWKALFFLHPETKSNDKETYGFNSTKTPPIIDEMKKFEEDVLRIIEGNKFRKIKNEFLSKLDQDVKNINKSESIFVPADKTTNFYKLGRDKYNKLLRDNTTAKYKRTKL